MFYLQTNVSTRQPRHTECLSRNETGPEQAQLQGRGRGLSAEAQTQVTAGREGGMGGTAKEGPVPGDQ